MDEMREDIVKLQTVIELSFKRVDEKLDAMRSENKEDCTRIEKRIDKHEKLIDIITKRLDGLSWKVVGWVMAGVSIPIILGVAITRLF